MREVSSFFPAVSKELHVSLSNVENVKEIKKMKVLAAAKEVSENVKRAKILENYNSCNQLRTQRRLEDSQNAREFDPETAAIDDITLDMIDEEPQRVQKKRNQYARPRNWDTQHFNIAHSSILPCTGMEKSTMHYIYYFKVGGFISCCSQNVPSPQDAKSCGGGERR